MVLPPVTATLQPKVYWDTQDRTAHSNDHAYLTLLRLVSIHPVSRGKMHPSLETAFSECGQAASGAPSPNRAEQTIVHEGEPTVQLKQTVFSVLSQTTLPSKMSLNLR